MQVAFPLRVDGRGRTAGADDDTHIRDLVEQVLFTAPGERVNRPDFGTGLLQLVFAPTSDELATATELLVQGALERWLGDVIDLRHVEVRSEASTLEVTVAYVIRRTGESTSSSFVREV